MIFKVENLLESVLGENSHFKKHLELKKKNKKA